MKWFYNRTYRERFYFATAIRGALSKIRETAIIRSTGRSAERQMWWRVRTGAARASRSADAKALQSLCVETLKGGSAPPTGTPTRTELPQKSAGILDPALSSLGGHSALKNNEAFLTQTIPQSIEFIGLSCFPRERHFFAKARCNNLPGTHPVAQPGGRQGVVSKGKHSQGQPGRLQHQGQRLSIGGCAPVSSRSPGDPVFRHPQRVR